MPTYSTGQPPPVPADAGRFSYIASSRSPYMAFGKAVGPGCRRFYIAASGNNNYSGTDIEHPRADFTNVNNLPMGGQLMPGDMILIKGGDTIVVGSPPLRSPPLRPQGSGTATAPISICSYGGGTATISTKGNFSAIILVDVGGYRISHLNLQGDGMDHGEPGSDRWGIGGVAIFHGASNRVLAPIWLESLSVAYFMNGPGIYVYGQTNGSGGGYSKVVITGCDVSFCLNGIAVTDTTCIATFVQSLAITNNTVHDNPGKPDVGGFNPSGFGIQVAGVYNGLIQGNTVSKNGAQGGTGNTAGGCCITYASDHILIQYNNFTGQQRVLNTTGDGFGVEINEGSTNIVVQYNWVSGNVGPGLCISNDDVRGGQEAVSNIIFRYNIVVDNDGEFVLPNSLGSAAVPGQHEINNIHCYNNTFVHVQGPPYSHNGAIYLINYVGRRAPISEIFIRNNIIYHAALRDTTRSYDLMEVNKILDSRGTDFTDLEFQGNLYWSIAASQVFVVWDGMTYKGTTLTAWQNDTGQEKAPPDFVNPTGVVGDPRFFGGTDYSVPANLKLTAGSAAIRAGPNLFASPYNYVWDPYHFQDLGLPIYPNRDGIPLDYFGTPLIYASLFWDIGAHHFLG
jgi:hypothetical protein